MEKLSFYSPSRFSETESVLKFSESISLPYSGEYAWDDCHSSCDPAQTCNRSFMVMAGISIPFCTCHTNFPKRRQWEAHRKFGNLFGCQKKTQRVEWQFFYDESWVSNIYADKNQVFSRAPPLILYIERFCYTVRVNAVLCSMWIHLLRRARYQKYKQCAYASDLL